MGRKPIILTLLLFTGLFSLCKADYQEKPINMTPFVGTDYVRIVIDEDYSGQPKNTFTVAIRSLQDQEILWEGAVDLVPTTNVGKKQLEATIGDLSPRLWRPSDPYLYEIALTQFSNKQPVDSSFI